MAIDNVELHEELARTLGHFKHPNARRMLLALCSHQSGEVREAATESLLQLYRSSASEVLGDLSGEPVVAKVLADSQLTAAPTPTRASSARGWCGTLSVHFRKFQPAALGRDCVKTS
jgi:hypothetical protein